TRLGILLCSSSRADGWLGRVEDPVDLAGEVALQAVADLLGGAALGSSSLDVGPGFRVMCHAGEDGDVQGPVQTSIAAAVEAGAEVFPEDAGIGLTPARAANAASERTRP